MPASELAHRLRHLARVVHLVDDTYEPHVDAEVAELEQLVADTSSRPRHRTRRQGG